MEHPNILSITDFNNFIDSFLFPYPEFTVDNFNDPLFSLVLKTPLTNGLVLSLVNLASSVSCKISVWMERICKDNSIPFTRNNSAAVLFNLKKKVNSLKKSITKYSYVSLTLTTLCFQNFKLKSYVYVDRLLSHQK